MLYIETKSLNPHFNLAAEEYFVTQKDEEIFMLWKNSDSVIVGRNQNTMAEVDYNYVTENRIPVVRRMSGGGAVFHDAENLNFTYITNNGTFGDYNSFTCYLRDYLATLGIEALLSGRNDLLCNGMKISGNAQYVYRNRIMHHGTILIGTDMKKLSLALTPDPEKIRSKGIKSVKSRVINLNELINITSDEFFAGFKNYILENGATEYQMTEKDLKEIKKLELEKYNTFEWNWGYSPKYNFRKKKYFPCGSVEIFLEIENATIKSAEIYGDFFSEGDVEIIKTVLHGTKHDKDSVLISLKNVWSKNIIGDLSAEDFCECIF